MRIERNISKLVVFSHEPIIYALQKISDNKSGFVVSVSEQGRLEGVLTDGDVRRWLVSRPSFDLNVSIGHVANPNAFALPVTTDPKDIADHFSSKIRAIPLLDTASRVVAVAQPGESGFSVGDRAIGAEHPAYVIAEIGNNHNGDLALGRRLIDLAVDAGADCAKFQLRDLRTLYRGGGRADDASQDLGAQYTLDLLSRYNLSNDDMFRLFEHCLERGIQAMCTPWDETSLAALERFGMAAYKVASADLTNHGLLGAIASTGKPVIASTGMAIEWEIREAVALLRSNSASFALLHCNSTYPAPFKDINLKYMARLAEIGDCPVGYSGHERGWAVPVAAVALGATIVEKHFTVDRSMEGNDHKVSLLPDEFAAMVAAIRATEESMGAAESRTMTQGEMMNREVLAKSLHAAVDVAAGAVVTDNMIVVQSPGQGLQPNRRGDLVGRRMSRMVVAGSPFFPSDLTDEQPAARSFHFDRPFGVPVRWHDWAALLPLSNFDLLEYHLSYKDLEVDLSTYFEAPLDVDYVVHAPELFAGDHILDLSSEDGAYRARSIAELQRVVALTRTLGQWHPAAQRPKIIVNAGGFTTTRPLPVGARPALYDRIADSLAQMDLEGVELIPQTMPPFPWHFGGQSYHNLFVDPDEIVAFCRRLDMRVCFDVSHSQLACNHFKRSMRDFARKLGPFTAHLHIVDARGVDGEGLQIGEGTIDFVEMAGWLDQYCPGASFVPEIWQGHKESGAGFWLALDRLERAFDQAGSIDVDARAAMAS